MSVKTAMQTAADVRNYIAWARGEDGKMRRSSFAARLRMECSEAGTRRRLGARAVTLGDSYASRQSGSVRLVKERQVYTFEVECGASHNACAAAEVAGFQEPKGARLPMDIVELTQPDAWAALTSHVENEYAA